MKNELIALAAHNCIQTIVLPDGFTTFRRFTNQQMAEYGKDFLFNTLSQCPSGVYLALKTSGSYLSFRVNLEYAKVYLPAIAEMGLKDWKYAIYSAAQNFVGRTVMEMKDTFDLVLSDGRIISAKLKKGKITIDLGSPSPEPRSLKLYLPVFPFVAICDIESDEEVTVDLSAKDMKTCYCFGDSITQGFNAHFPSRTYVSIIGRHYNMETLNFGVGGYYFDEASLDGMENLPKPDILTIAYGTNDWTLVDSIDVFRGKVEAYFNRISQLYEGIPAYVISPIWRGDLENPQEMGSFLDMCQVVIDEALKKPDNRIIEGYKIPIHDKKYFGDSYLHPNAEGFEIMADSIIAEIGPKPFN